MLNFLNENQNGAILAPLAGYTDRAFREICKECGAIYTVTEMVSVKGLCYGDKNTPTLLSKADSEHPVAVQLFGDDPDFFKRAVEILEPLNFDVYDVNMGCPVPKVLSAGSGSALMREPKKAAAIISALKQSTKKAVSAKIRKGFDKDNINAPDFAKTLEEAGADFITVHGRLKTDFYRGVCDLDIIRDVVAAVKIPVIGNGDVVDKKSYDFMKEYTGCAAIMIGRGALGNPFIFTEVMGEETSSLPHRLSMMVAHTKRTALYKGEHRGILEMRKQLAHYLKGLRGASKLRGATSSVNTILDVEDLAREAMLLQEFE